MRLAFPAALFFWYTYWVKVRQQATGGVVPARSFGRVGIMTHTERVLQAFEQQFGDTEGVRLFFAPGRVNLIGEHTDYNGGHVFPCAISLGTYAAARKRTDRVMRFFSVNFEKIGVISTSLDELTPS